MNPYALAVAIIPLLYVLWLVGRPLEAVALAAELKRRYRRWIIRRHGEAAARLFEQQLRARAGRDRLKQEAVDIVMRQERERIIQEFGAQFANEFLGSPCPLERDF